MSNVPHECPVCGDEHVDRIRPEIAGGWVEPNGEATTEGLHPHYALWNHERARWDPLPQTFRELDRWAAAQPGLDVQRLAELERSATDGPWIRPWGATHIHSAFHGTVDLTDQHNLDFIVAACNFVRHRQP